MHLHAAAALSSRSDLAEMVMCATDAGLRVAEVLGLTPEAIVRREDGVRLHVFQQVEKDTGRIKATKGKRMRTLPITRRLADALEPLAEAAGPGGLLFTNRAGKPLDYAKWRREVAPGSRGRGRRADSLPRPPARLRLEAGRQGRPADQDSGMDGSASLSMTERYLHGIDSGDGAMLEAALGGR